MDLFHFDPATTLSFLLTLFRISIILFLFPFFGGEGAPWPVKAALCLVLTLGLWPAVSFSAEYFPGHPLNIALMLMGEVIIGLVLGLIVQFIFAAVQTGGQLIGFQMGFAMMNVVDPLTGVSEAVTAHFLYMVALLVFLALNGHLYLLKGLADTFEYVPPGQLFISPELTKQVIKFSANMFVLAIKVASPVIVALFLVDLALGLVARAAPQMNVLFVGFPLKVTVGFLFLGLIFTVLSRFMETFVSGLVPQLRFLLQLAP
ncbi:MAG: flagellar biosynthetic protein FliR [Desulfovibrionales bacterium]